MTLRERLYIFLSEHNTMTLATVADTATPHACALFYAADAEMNLYFLSEPKTLHALHIGDGAAVAITVEQNNQSWTGIRGLQLSAFAQPCTEASLMERARQVYSRRFPFVGKVETLSGPLSRARYYCVTPDWIRFIDNTQGFGHKEEWIR